MRTLRSGPDTEQAGSGAHGLLLVMVVIWGVNFPIAKAALAELSPLAFNALRFPLAAATVLVALQYRSGFRLPERDDRLRILGLGILGNLVYQQFFIFGLDNTRAGNASILLAGTPILTALLSAAAGHERVTARVWAGVVATFFGIALVVLLGGGHADGGATLLGDALMVAASLAWAFYTVGSRDLVARYGAIQFTAWTLCIGAAALFFMGLPSVLRTDLGAISAAAWVGVVYAGALSIGVAYLIWYYGVERIGNTRTATYSNLVPVVALAAAWLRLGEVPLPGQVLGAAVIIGGITLVQRRRPAIVGDAGAV
ncbi:MAG TPA: DMT family transporter [Longimicrobiales bacterium]|nr:DMT family transporter [Longimicrobiales bacterium]